jgi:hypothetical protein
VDSDVLELIKQGKLHEADVLMAQIAGFRHGQSEA